MKKVKKILFIVLGCVGLALGAAAAVLPVKKNEVIATKAKNALGPFSISHDLGFLPIF